jgi:DNA-binding beta-propeller fold protein YncE
VSPGSGRRRIATRGRHAPHALRRPARATLSSPFGRRRGIWRCLLPAAGVLLATAAAVAGVLLWPRGLGIPPAGLGPGVPAPTLVREIGTTGAGALRQPLGVAVAGGKVYVADAERGEVVVFGSDGEYVTAFGGDTLSTPLYVAENPLDGHLYVSDRKTARVHIFDLSGAYLGLLEPMEVTDGPRLRDGWLPLALAFGSSGTMYLTDASEPQRVLMIGPTRKLLAQAARPYLPPGPSGSALSYANGVAVSGDGVLVVDSNNRRLLLFDEGLRLVRIRTFDGLPRGACVVPTAAGAIYAVVDASGYGVRLVTSGGALLRTFSGVETTAGPMIQPTAVAHDGRSLLYVTDTGNRRVLQLRLGSVAVAAPLGLPRIAPDTQSLAAWALGIVGTLIALVAGAMCARTQRRLTL